MAEAADAYPPDLASGARTYAMEKTPEFEALLKRLVEFPTITPGGGHESECLALAQSAVEMFQSLGASETWLEETGGMPCIVARFPKEGSTQNIVIYNHMDVVPIARENEWLRKPFEFVVEEDKEGGAMYYGRGTTDDKGPALTALFGALCARSLFDVPVDLTFLWELEEEIGSPNFGTGLAAMRPRLPARVDLCICSDTLWISDDLPTVVETVRGSISFDVEVHTAAGDVHSGICGGGARNPLNELCILASRIAAADGSALLPSLRDATPLRSGADLLADIQCGLTSEGFKNDFKLHSTRTNDPAEILERTWARPCVEIVGVRGGYQGTGVASMIPPEASLKFNVRTVVGLSLDDVERDVRELCSELIPDAKVSVFGRMPAFDARLTSQQRNAMCRAFRAGCRCQPAFGAVGGSIGVLQTLQDKLETKVLLPSLSSPSQGYHGVNENYSRQRFQDGVVTYVVLLAELVGRVGA